VLSLICTLSGKEGKEMVEIRLYESYIPDKPVLVLILKDKELIEGFMATEVIIDLSVAENIIRCVCPNNASYVVSYHELTFVGKVTRFVKVNPS